MPATTRTTSSWYRDIFLRLFVFIVLACAMLSTLVRQHLRRPAPTKLLKVSLLFPFLMRALHSGAFIACVISGSITHLIRARPTPTDRNVYQGSSSNHSVRAPSPLCSEFCLWLLTCVYAIQLIRCNRGRPITFNQYTPNASVASFVLLSHIILSWPLRYPDLEMCTSCSLVLKQIALDILLPAIAFRHVHVHMHCSKHPFPLYIQSRYSALQLFDVWTGFVVMLIVNGS